MPLTLIDRLYPWEKRLVAGSLIGWILLLLGGILIPTQGYRDAVAALTAGRALVPDVLIILAFYTVTNVLLLCWLTAILGAAGARARIELEDETGKHDLVNPYTSALLRGFFVYLVILSGAMVSVQDPVQNFLPATQEQYVRLAALMSVLGFIVGYNPEFFTKIFRGAEAGHKPSTDKHAEGQVAT